MYELMYILHIYDECTFVKALRDTAMASVIVRSVMAYWISRYSLMSRRIRGLWQTIVSRRWCLIQRISAANSSESARFITRSVETTKYSQCCGGRISTLQISLEIKDPIPATFYRENYPYRQAMCVKLSTVAIQVVVVVVVVYCPRKSICNALQGMTMLPQGLKSTQVNNFKK